MKQNKRTKRRGVHTVENRWEESEAESPTHWQDPTCPTLRACGISALRVTQTIPCPPTRPPLSPSSASPSSSAPAPLSSSAPRRHPSPSLQCLGWTAPWPPAACVGEQQHVDAQQSRAEQRRGEKHSHEGWARRDSVHARSPVRTQKHLAARRIDDRKGWGQRAEVPATAGADTSRWMGGGQRSFIPWLDENLALNEMQANHQGQSTESIAPHVSPVMRANMCATVGDLHHSARCVTECSYQRSRIGRSATAAP